MHRATVFIKSADAGKTWRNIGLRDSHQIGRILIHPTNADIVYIAALGHAYGSNAERGVYRSITVALGKIGAYVGFAGAGVNNVEVGGRYFDGPDGGDMLIVEDARPGQAGVGGFPDAAANRAEVKDVGIAGDAGGSDGAPAPKRSDHPPAETVEEACGGLGGEGGCKSEDGEATTHRKTIPQWMAR
jgi:hypothetical protein